MAPSTSEEIITCLKSYPSACHKLSIMRNICRLSMSCRRSAQIPMCHLSTRCNTSRPALMKLNRLTSSFNSSEDLQLNLSPAYSTLTWQPWVVWHCWLGVRKSMSDEVPAWLSVCSKVQMIRIWSSWCHCHPVISRFIKIQIGFTFLAPSLPRLFWKRGR